MTSDNPKSLIRENRSTKIYGSKIRKKKQSNRYFSGLTLFNLLKNAPMLAA